MKDFDDHRAKRLNKEKRTFKIGGETFVAKASVRPEALSEWDAMDPETSSPNEMIEISDRTILALIERDPEATGDDAHDRYRQLRLRDEDALNIEDITSLLKWLIGVQSGGRPTEPASASGGSRNETGESSTGGSSSPGSPAEPELSTSGSS